MKKIDTIYCFLSVDANQNEALLPAMTGEDEETVLENREIAQKIATKTGQPVLLVRFNRATDYEIFK